LLLSLSDVLSQDRPLLPEHYPDNVTIHGVALPASYRFDPSAEDDGVTLAIPLAFLPQLGQGELDGTIPAWRELKLAALLETLPRALRRELGSIPELAAKLSARMKDAAGPLVPAMSAALFELTGVDVAEETFRPDAIPAYLRFNCRVIGERGRVIAESRDVAMLLEQHAARAREVARLAAPRAEWERTGLTSWSFGELPQVVTRQVLGSELPAYPALVDRGTSVDLKLFEEKTAAESAHRAGLGRLLQLAAKSPLSALGKRVPPPFARRPGLPAPRAEAEAFRELVLSRVVAEAFGLFEGVELPRSQTAFERLLAAGLPRLSSVFERTARAIAGANAELEKTLRALDTASKEPSSAAASVDIKAQLEQLFFPELLLHVELERLEHFPRYLRAAQSRLTRAINDPRKDASKAEPFTPLWQTFLAKRVAARDQVVIRRLHFAFEELRVALFAPELKPAQSVTIANLSAAVHALR
jgi:ATP-dependent helicase HrpA